MSGSRPSTRRSGPGLGCPPPPARPLSLPDVTDLVLVRHHRGPAVLRRGDRRSTSGTRGVAEGVPGDVPPRTSPGGGATQGAGSPRRVPSPSGDPTTAGRTSEGAYPSRQWINNWNQDPKLFVWTKTADPFSEGSSYRCRPWRRQAARLHGSPGEAADTTYWAARRHCCVVHGVGTSTSRTRRSPDMSAGGRVSAPTAQVTSRRSEQCGRSAV